MYLKFLLTIVHKTRPKGNIVKLEYPTEGLPGGGSLIFFVLKEGVGGMKDKELKIGKIEDSHTILPILFVKKLFTIK